MQHHIRGKNVFSLKNTDLTFVFRAFWLCFFFCFFFVSCKKESLPYFIELNVENGWFPENPTNLSQLNTSFDDYNSNLAGEGQRIQLYYSNNYEKRGKDFDISAAVFDVFIPEERNGMSFQLSNEAPLYSTRLLPLINSEFNEFGPFGFYSDDEDNANTEWIFFYANDKNGDFDIQFCYTPQKNWGTYGASKEIYGPFEAKVLNSNVCDWYPTINKNRSKIFFSSYRTRTYNIFEIDVNSSDLKDWLQNGTNKAVLNQTLSSANYDKCPYIKGNLLVFTSNREGGFGGYDLYYSRFENGNWSAPVNFGPTINTKHDEFRPAIEFFPQSKNDLMIFSSNRPGGTGGFDLYFVGIDKMTE